MFSAIFCALDGKTNTIYCVSCQLCGFEGEKVKKENKKKQKELIFEKLILLLFKKERKPILFFFDANQNWWIVFLIDKFVGKNKEFIRVDGFAKGEQTIPF